MFHVSDLYVSIGVFSLICLKSQSANNTDVLTHLLRLGLNSPQSVQSLEGRYIRVFGFHVLAILEKILPK